MPNFGTYEGHRILSQGLQNSLDRGQRQMQFAHQKEQDKINNAMREQEFAETQKNNKIAREYKQAQMNKINTEIKQEKLLTELYRKDYATYKNNPIIKTDENGVKQLDFGSIKAINESIGQSNIIANDPNSVLTVDQIQQSNNNQANIVSDTMTDVKGYLSEFDEEQRDSLLVANPELDKELTKLRVTAGDQSDASNAEYFGTKSTDEKAESDMPFSSKLDEMYGWRGNSVTYSEEGQHDGDGSIKFEGTNHKDSKNANLILEAVEMSKNRYSNHWDESDDIRVKQRKDRPYYVIEDELGPWNAKFVVEMREHNGKKIPMVKTRGLWDNQRKSYSIMWRPLNETDLEHELPWKRK